jgi:serine/threonine-protein kinase RIM15
MYEFLYGFPPFHADTPDKVFDNIISRRIQWYEEHLEISPEARDLMERLMCMDPKQRLGAKGAVEVKAHPWFNSIDWANVMHCEANFVPNVTDPESTDYFDARGAKSQVFTDEALAETKLLVKTSPTSVTRQSADAPDASDHERYVADDFGTFTFKNLGELKQANDDVIRKLRTDSMAPSSQTMPGGLPRDRRLSVVAKMTARPRGSLADVSKGRVPMLLLHGPTLALPSDDSTFTCDFHLVHGVHSLTY